MRNKEYLIYWDEDSIRESAENPKILDRIYSKQFFRVRRGDRVWIVGPLKSRFVCLGSVRVADVAPKDDSWDIVGRDPEMLRVVDLTDEWKESLVFEDRSRPTCNDRTVPDGRELQSMRELGPRAEKWFLRKWSDG